MSSLLRWALAGLLATTILGCDLVGTPERYVDSSVRPPVVAALNFTDLREGQHLAGPVSFTVDLDSLGDRIDYVQLSVNGEPASTSTPPRPYTFTLWTDRYPEGPVTLGLAVYERDQSNQGLLGLAGAPSIALSTPVVFDQRTPTPATRPSR